MALRNTIIAGVAALSMGVLPAVAYAADAAPATGTGGIVGQVDSDAREGAVVGYGPLVPMYAAIGALVFVGALVALGVSDDDDNVATTTTTQ